MLEEGWMERRGLVASLKGFEVGIKKANVLGRRSE